MIMISSTVRGLLIIFIHHHHSLTARQNNKAVLSQRWPRDAPTKV